MGANEGCVGASRRCMRASGGNKVTSDGSRLLQGRYLARFGDPLSASLRPGLL